MVECWNGIMRLRQQTKDGLAIFFLDKKQFKEYSKNKKVYYYLSTLEGFHGLLYKFNIGLTHILTNS